MIIFELSNTFYEVKEINNKEGALLGILISFLLLVVIFVVTLLIVSHQIKNKEYKKTSIFKNERIFIINYKDSNPVVDYFDLNNLRKINTISFVDFLNFFPDSDQNDIKTFISSLFNFDYSPTSKESVLITNIIMTYHKRKTTYRAYLKCNGIDREKKVLYLSCTRLVNTPVEHRLAKKNTKHDVYEISLIKKMFDDGRFVKGILTTFKFYVKPNHISFYNEFLILRGAIDTLYSKTNNNVSFFYLGEESLEFSMLDLRTFNDYQLSRHSFELYELVERYLEINGLVETYSLKVCSAQVSDLPKNYDSAYNVLANLFKSAGEINRPVSIYSKGNNEVSILESTYKLELKRIIKQKSYKISFAPIIHMTNTRVSVFAYLTYIDFESTIILKNKDIFEFSKTFNLSKQLISVVFRDILPNFISQTGSLNYKLVINIPLNFLDEAIEAIKNIQDGDKTNLVFSIPSIDLIDEEESNSLPIKLSQIRRQGFDLAVFTKTGDYVLKRKTYLMFDYCFIDPVLEANVKQDSRSYIKFKSLYDKISKIGVPIIALNTKSFQSMELLSKTGIRDFSNDFISKRSPMLLPLNPKIVKKIISMVK